MSWYPHLPQLDGDAVLFSDVWNTQEYCLSWVVGHDGAVHEPLAA